MAVSFRDLREIVERLPQWRVSPWLEGCSLSHAWVEDPVTPRGRLTPKVHLGVVPHTPLLHTTVLDHSVVGGYTATVGTGCTAQGWTGCEWTALSVTGVAALPCRIWTALR